MPRRSSRPPLRRNDGRDLLGGAEGVRAAFAARPLALVIDDVHWAEPTLLDLVEHLVSWTRDAPLLLLCLARPELLDERPAWGGQANVEILTLEPLSQAESEELIEELLGDSELDVDTRTRIRRWPREPAVRRAAARDACGRG